jgi:beta-lactamase class A
MVKTLRDSILLELQINQISAGIYIEDLKDGETFTIQPDLIFPSASVIKTPIAVHILELVEAGELDLATTLHLDLSQPAYQQPAGSGVITHLTSRLDINIHDLLFLSLAESDNLATNELLKLTSLDAINTTLEERGLLQTRVTVPIDNFALLADTQSNPTTARDMGMLFRALYQRRLPLSDVLMDILAEQKYNNRIPLFLPEFDDDLRIPHKTGSLRGLVHDTGMVIRPEFCYTICVLTRSDSTWLNASMTIARISKLVYDWMVNKYASPSYRSSVADPYPTPITL